jgi:hypothetical protein
MFSLTDTEIYYFSPISVNVDQNCNISILFQISWINSLTLVQLSSRIWRAPNNAGKWRMGFNSEFKGLSQVYFYYKLLFDCSVNVIVFLRQEYRVSVYYLRLIRVEPKRSIQCFEYFKKC